MHVFICVRAEISRYPVTTKTPVDKNPLPQQAKATVWTSVNWRVHVGEYKRFSDTLSHSLSDCKCVTYGLVVGISNAAASTYASRYATTRLLHVHKERGIRYSLTQKWWLTLSTK